MLETNFFNMVVLINENLFFFFLFYNSLGSMIAFFRYSPIDILSVCLPPSELEFIPHAQQGWLRKEAAEVIYRIQIYMIYLLDVELS